MPKRNSKSKTKSLQAKSLPMQEEINSYEQENLVKRGFKPETAKNIDYMNQTASQRGMGKVEKMKKLTRGY
jgi:hypothetical protein